MDPWVRNPLCARAKRSPPRRSFKTSWRNLEQKPEPLGRYAVSLTRTHTHTRTHARARAHTHTHTHTHCTSPSCCFTTHAHSILEGKQCSHPSCNIAMCVGAPDTNFVLGMTLTVVGTKHQNAVRATKGMGNLESLTARVL